MPKPLEISLERGDVAGIKQANGTSYLNVNSKKPLGKVFWHESMHWLKKNNAELYGKLVQAAQISDEQRDAFLEQSKRTDLVTDEAIDEKILADQMEDVAKRTGLLQNMAGKNRGLRERVVQWLKDTMNKFVDQNGRKIFRYNRRTHTIELADGRGLARITSPENEKALILEKY